MPHYENAVIYKIHSLNPDVKEIYVGSTCDFANRKYHHKRNCNKPSDKKYHLKVYTYIRDNGGWDKFMMTPIKMYPCKSKMELHIEERKNIEELNATLNSSVPGRTDKEYREQNKEKIKQQKKEYYEQNKDKFKEYQIKNREKLKEYRKEYYKEYAIKNKEKIKQQHLNYYEQNKDKKKEYAIKNKDKRNAQARARYAKKKQERLNQVNNI